MVGEKNGELVDCSELDEPLVKRVFAGHFLELYHNGGEVQGIQPDSAQENSVRANRANGSSFIFGYIFHTIADDTHHLE
jgi:hypothetical protein